MQRTLNGMEEHLITAAKAYFSSVNSHIQCLAESFLLPDPAVIQKKVQRHPEQHLRCCLPLLDYAHQLRSQGESDSEWVSVQLRSYANRVLHEAIDSVSLTTARVISELNGDKFK